MLCSTKIELFNTIRLKSTTPEKIMAKWAQPAANWLTILCRHNDLPVYAIGNWLQSSTGWIQGLRGYLQTPRANTYDSICLAKTAFLEVWLTSWGKDVSAEFVKPCWTRVIQGTLYEETPYACKQMNTGATQYQEEPRRMHTLAPAFSIHICLGDER